MSKPIIDLNNIRELLKIDVSRGVFEADTREEQERGLKILEQIGRLHAQSSAQGSSTAAEVPSPSAMPVRPPARNFTDIVSAYLQEAGLTLKPATVYKHQQTFKAFCHHLGDLPVNKYLKEDVKAFKTKLLNEEKTGHTINQYLSHLRTFFTFATNNGYSDNQTNPVEGLLIVGAKKVVNPRDQFYEDDLKTIFKWEHYKKLAIKPDYFWGPLVCLFTGMRIEEVTSLELKHFKTQDGIRILNVRDAKTAAGNRSVPIHSKLIELGFLEYFDEVKNRHGADSRLFWYLNDGHNGTKKNLSRRFSEYLVKIGVKEDDNCFHSLRHTVITRLAARKVNDSTSYQLTGHQSDKSAHYDYLHPLPVPVLKDAVEQLDFHNLLNFEKFDAESAYKILRKSEGRMSNDAAMPQI
jgi:integrase